jgi:hypothetical protein
MPAVPAYSRISVADYLAGELVSETKHDYVLIEQDHLAAVVYSRGSSGFEREVYEGIDASIPLPESDAVLLLEEVFEGIR